jgi:hypothetical protein
MDENKLKDIVIEAWRTWELEPDLLLCPRITAFAKWFIENDPSYSDDITSDNIYVWIRQKEAEDNLKKALMEMYNVIDPLINSHLDTLLKKRRRLFLKDDYGFINDSKWQEELGYFMNRAVISKTLDVRVSVAAYISLLRAADNPGVIGINDNIDDFPIVEDYIKGYINAVLDNHAEEMTDQSIDVSTLDPNEYEHFCADLLKEIGWNVRVTQASGDQGIDVLAEKDGFLLALQCKKYSSPVGNKAVQEAYSGGTFYEAKATAVVSPVEYTSSAKELANSLGVLLLHHDDLSSLTVTDKEQE